MNKTSAAIDINKIYNQISEKLSAANLLDILQALENSNAGAATGSESLMLTGKYLKDLKRTEQKAYNIIQNEILQYLKYCKNNGLIIQ